MRQDRRRSRWLGWGVALSLAAAGAAAALVTVDERRARADATTPARGEAAREGARCAVGGGVATPAVDADEYAVYRALLVGDGGDGGDGGERPAAARSDADRAVMVVDALTTARGDGEMEGARADTVRDFAARNRVATPLVDRFGLGRRVVFLSEREERALFAPRDGRSDGWRTFYARYPGSPGITSLSRVGFDAQRRQALVYFGRQSDWLAGAGELVLLSRDARGVFRVVARRELWIS